MDAAAGAALRRMPSAQMRWYSASTLARLAQLSDKHQVFAGDFPVPIGDKGKIPLLCVENTDGIRGEDRAQADHLGIKHLGFCKVKAGIKRHTRGNHRLASQKDMDESTCACRIGIMEMCCPA